MNDTSNLEKFHSVLVKTGILHQDSDLPESEYELWELLEDQLGERCLSYDMETIENTDSYEWVFSYYHNRIKDEINIEGVKSVYDRENNKASIEMVVNGHLISSEWEQNHDFVEGVFYSFISKKLEPLLNGKFISFPFMWDQCWYDFYINEPAASEVQLVVNQILDNLSK